MTHLSWGSEAQAPHMGLDFHEYGPWSTALPPSVAALHVPLDSCGNVAGYAVKHLEPNRSGIECRAKATTNVVAPQGTRH